MTGTEKVPETLVIFNQLTRLVARDDFINILRNLFFDRFQTTAHASYNACFVSICNFNLTRNFKETLQEVEYKLNCGVCKLVAVVQM
jgi:hypothetical protein